MVIKLNAVYVFYEKVDLKRTAFLTKTRLKNGLCKCVCSGGGRCVIGNGGSSAVVIATMGMLDVVIMVGDIVVVVVVVVIVVVHVVMHVVVEVVVVIVMLMVVVMVKEVAVIVIVIVHRHDCSVHDYVATVATSMTMLTPYPGSQQFHQHGVCVVKDHADNV